MPRFFLLGAGDEMRNLLLLGFAALVLYLCLWPVEIDPAAWLPPPAPKNDARFSENEHLAGLQRIAQGIGLGPEAVNLDDQGRIITGFKDGRVMRFAVDGSRAELLADTGGRPLGLDFDSNGQLIVVDAVKGLLRIGDNGNWSVIANSAAGVPMGFADDVVISDDDVAYYSDASVRYGVHQVMEDFFEHRPHGRILATDLKSGETRVLVPNLHFANGVALGPDDAYLVFNETARYRVSRHWLKGERAGQTEVFIDNLPGLPDNISFNGRDTFWLALYAPRAESLDALLPRPFLRKVIWRLPGALRPGPALHAFALGLNLDGEVVFNLQDPGTQAYAPITSVREGAEYLYFGSLSANSMARMPLASLPAPMQP